MNAEYTAVIKKTGNWWIGWVEEVSGVNCQARIQEELLESLRLTLKEALKLNWQDALSVFIRVHPCLVFIRVWRKSDGKESG